ncbi:vacuolar fusion protein CCZ1 isoform X3 [Oratosquilla oratoria]|uniref:vacuolar fusion protein CCZ1 isoform X3 n=1 Tax=Oratosquilla oratoria TaxID=337810 RepID=UPI003F75FD9A
MAAESSSQPYLKNFFIFNSSYGQKEGQEHEKVLYYHPSSTELDTQVRQVGLAEAITRFASQFNKTEDCESLHTQKTRQVFYQPEQNIWMVMTIGVGWISRERDMGLVKEYQGEEVQDVVYQSHLKHAYRAFTLLHSSFAAALSSGGVQGLKATLNSFFSTYLTSVNVSQGDILDVWSGVSFLPLDKQTFLRVHCCLSLLQATVPAIAHTAFLFNTNIVWCGLCAEDLRSLSHYLKTQILCGHSGVGPPESPTTTSYLTRFVGSGTTPSLLIYVRGETDSLEPHHLLLYTLQGATVCLTISGVEEQRWLSKRCRTTGLLDGLVMEGNSLLSSITGMQILSKLLMRSIECVQITSAISSWLNKYMSKKILFDHMLLGIDNDQLVCYY